MCVVSLFLVSDRCEDCSVVFARYACLECRLYDNLEEGSTLQKEGVFHCDLCGICRVGRREDFVHCSICNCCRRISPSSSCAPTKTRPLFSSSSSSSSMSMSSSSSGEGSGEHCMRKAVDAAMEVSPVIGDGFCPVADHVCIENALDHNCALCQEYLFDSVYPLETLRCGHAFHATCLASLMTQSHVCPICRSPVS